MKHLRLLNCFLIVSFLMVLVIPGSAQGPLESANSQQQAQSTCDTAQFIVMVDFSNSMLRNDTTDLRFTGPLHLADVLASYYLNARLISDRVNRPIKLELAVVQFASEGHIGLEWTTIAPSSYEAWETQRADLEAKLNLGRDGEYTLKMETIGNGTNHKEGFNEVIKLLNQKGSPVNGCPERTFLVITDGLPDRSGEPYEGQGLEDYMLGTPSDDIGGRYSDGFIQMVRSYLSSPGDRVYVTGINDSEDNYWPKAEEYWQAVTCDNAQNRANPSAPLWNEITCDETQWNAEEPARAERVTTPAELGLRIDKIVTYRLGSGIVVIEPGPTTIPPYLERIVFTFYKPDIGNIIELRDPLGQVMDCSHPQVDCLGETEGIQTLQVTRPYPGKYALYTNAQSDEFIITRELIFAQGKLAAVDQHLQQFTTSLLQMNLVDSAGEPLPSYGDKYRLLVDAVVTPPPETGGAPYPISIIDTGTGQLEGSFTPIYNGANHISIQASVLDDDGQKWEVLRPPYADFDMLVDQVGFNVGQIISERASEGCAPGQFTPFSFQTQLINLETLQPAQISLPVNWTITAPGLTISAPTGPDSEQRYTFNGTVDQSGEIALQVSATVPDPQDPVTQLELGEEKTILVTFASSRRYEFKITAVSPIADPVSVWIEGLLRSIQGKKDPNYLLVGREWFFVSQNVEVAAQVNEVGFSGSPVPAEMLPVLLFEPENGGNTITGGIWEAKEGGGLHSYTENLSLGCYLVSLDPKSASCEVTLEADEIVNRVCLVPGLTERIIEFVLGLLVACILLFGVRLAICRFSNPLWGMLAIQPTNGSKAKWYNSIADWSCWNFTVDEPEQNGQVTRIVIYGALRKKGRFKLRYYLLRDAAGKENVHIDVSCDLDRWNDIILTTGHQIIWRRSENEFQH